MNKRKIIIFLFVLFVIIVNHDALSQFGIQNITYTVLDSSVEIHYDILGGWNTEYNIIAVTVSEKDGMPFYSITENIRGKMGGIIPGKDKTLLWMNTTNRLKEKDLQFKIYISKYPAATQLSNEKFIPINPEVGSKKAWIFLGTFVGFSLYAFQTKDKSNNLYTQYSDAVDWDKIKELKKQIKRKDRYFQISLGAATISAVLCWYYAFHYSGNRKINYDSSHKYSMDFSIDPTNIGISIRRKF